MPNLPVPAAAPGLPSPDRRRAERAATIGLMLLKASLRGLEPDAAPIEPTRNPALAGGAAAQAEEIA